MKRAKTRPPMAQFSESGVFYRYWLFLTSFLIEVSPCFPTRNTVKTTKNSYFSWPICHQCYLMYRAVVLGPTTLRSIALKQSKRAVLTGFTAKLTSFTSFLGTEPWGHLILADWTQKTAISTVFHPFETLTVPNYPTSH